MPIDYVVAYLVGDTVTAAGSITFDAAVTATVNLRVLNTDGTLVATVIDGVEVDFTANVPKTFEEINGGSPAEWVSDVAAELEWVLTIDEYPDVDDRAGFVVAEVVPAFIVPVLAVADDGDGSVTCTVTNNTGQVGRLYYRKASATAWTLHGTTISGNGTITDLTGLDKGLGADAYTFVAVPYDSASGAWGVPSKPVLLHLADASATATTSELDDELTDSLAGLFAELGRTVTYNPYGGTPAEVSGIVQLDEAPFMDDPEKGEQIWRGQLRLKSTDATAPSRRDTFTVDGIAYGAANEPRTRAGAVLFLIERLVTVRRNAAPRRG